MARIRSIKPEYWSSEEVMALPRDARLLFIGIWNFCDDAGRFKWSPGTIKAQVFPGDSDLDAAKVEGLMLLIAERGLLERYGRTTGGLREQYGRVTGWHHQRISKPTPSKYPGPNDFIDIAGAVREDSGSSTGGLRDGSAGICLDLPGREGERAPPLSEPPESEGQTESVSGVLPMPRSANDGAAMSSAHVHEWSDALAEVFERATPKRAAPKATRDQTWQLAEHVRDIARVHGVPFREAAIKLAQAALDASSKPPSDKPAERYPFFLLTLDPYARGPGLVDANAAAAKFREQVKGVRV